MFCFRNQSTLNQFFSSSPMNSVKGLPSTVFGVSNKCHDPEKKWISLQFYYFFAAILSLYFVASLGYSQDNATVMYHTFVMLSYFFPMIGGIIADTWLGKFKYVSWPVNFKGVIFRPLCSTHLMLSHTYDQQRALARLPVMKVRSHVPLCVGKGTEGRTREVQNSTSQIRTLRTICSFV